MGSDWQLRLYHYQATRILRLRLITIRNWRVAKTCVPGNYVSCRSFFLFRSRDFLMTIILTISFLLSFFLWEWSLYCKLMVGIPRMQGLPWRVTLASPGNSLRTPIVYLHQSPPSPVPGTGRAASRRAPNQPRCIRIFVKTRFPPIFRIDPALRSTGSIRVILKATWTRSPRISKDKFARWASSTRNLGAPRCWAVSINLIKMTGVLNVCPSGWTSSARIFRLAPVKHCRVNPERFGKRSRLSRLKSRPDLSRTVVLLPNICFVLRRGSQSPVSKIETRIDRPKSVVGVIRVVA